ncbi:MAG: VWA domain-containing protein [candidate division Zixibacteria bacterium]|nr:VWA domain-containing protein [candidate division Zixibacteria bacterium]NIR63578.1 VWA domain-containing protein [candidate division Zixibacteria bacterium]NIS18179.1 VWA domain-containing protein [candidate division Zixibacteria bacterium]NIS45542.1 VWA domain-containing protein [candidate division Zixibacteria bacterium]NIT54447.1 VWA domain-containing protein [candidate division Zixibacteria bacterium]
MKFFQPEYWFLLLIVPLLALFFLWSWQKRKHDRDVFLRGMPLENLGSSFASGKVALKAAFILIAFVFAVVALARPQWGAYQELIKREGLDVMVVLDVSRSMDVEDESLGGMSRLEKAKLEISRLRKRLPGDRLGLTLFDRDAFIYCPLTLDHSAFDMYLDVVKADLMPAEGQGTRLSRAIQTAMNGFDPKSKQSKILVVFSDGETFDDNLDEAMNQAETMEVKIYSVGVGSTRGGLIPIKNRAGDIVDYVKDESGTDALSKLNVRSLEIMAAETGGNFYLASSGGRVLRSLVEDITGFEKAELEGKLITQYEDRFQIPLLISLLFFALEFVLSDVRGTPWWRVFVR